MPHTGTEQAEDGGSASKTQSIIKHGKTSDETDYKVLILASSIILATFICISK